MMENNPQFKISEPKTIITILMLGCTVIGNLFEIVLGIVYILSIKRIEKGDILSESEIFFSEGLFGLSQLGNVLVTILCAIPFCLWIYQAYKNLFSLEAKGLQYSPNWAVGGFFIPIANLFYPGKIVKELFNASDPDIPNPNPRNWVDVKEPKLVSFWWTSFLLATCLNQLSNIFFRQNTLSNLKHSTMLFIAADVSLIVAAFFATFMILEINKKQKQKYNLINSVKSQYHFGNTSETPREI